MIGTRRLGFFALVAAQALVPLLLVGVNEVALARGTEIRLQTVPVDPLDPFRGRYVTLRYDVSSLPVAGGVARGDTVYVALAERGGVWTGTVARHERPPQGPFLRGRVTRARGAEAEIAYGIETYYADEHEARRLESEARGRLLVDVVVAADGRAQIRRVQPGS